MKKLCGGVVGLCLALGLAGVSAAQDKNMMGVPKVLTVTREFVKPGRTGADHDKAESVFVKAMTAAKWPTHYIGLNSLSGKQRCLFLSGYDNFEAWEKDNAKIQKNATLAAALDRAAVADGRCWMRWIRAYGFFAKTRACTRRPASRTCGSWSLKYLR